MCLSDASRRRQRLRGLLSAVQSNVESPAHSSRTTAAAAAFLALTTASAAHNDDVPDADDGDGRVAGPFLSPVAALSFTSTQRRRRRRAVLRRGIVCECCVHRCHLDELQGYCGTPTN